jgi:hypothetical protein
MDDAERRAQLKRHWDYGGSDQDIAHEIYHDDAVLEFPQSANGSTVSTTSGSGAPVSSGPQL